MVKQNFIYFLLGLLLLACSDNDDSNCITASGSLVSETREMTDFHSVSFEGVGTIDFSVENTKHQLQSGDMLSLSGGVPHHLKALSDSIVRLTLSKMDKLRE